MYFCKKHLPQWLQQYGLSSVCVFWSLSRLSFYKDGMTMDLCNVYNLEIKTFFLDWGILINVVALIQFLHIVLLNVASRCLASSPFHRKPYHINCIRKVFHQCASSCAYQDNFHETNLFHTWMH